jgi:hypothetical protein
MQKVIRELWILVFLHNITGGFFESREEAAYNPNSQHKYSILSKISDRDKFNGKFEFKLIYPELNEFNHWRQSNNPIVEEDDLTKAKATGYEPIKITWSGSNWGGLLRTKYHYSSECLPTLIDGSIGVKEWWFSIGRVKNCTGGEGSTTTFPGPNGNRVKHVELWMRTQFFSCECTQRSTFYSVSLSVQILLSYHSA